MQLNRNYQLCAMVDGAKHFFEYDECGGLLDALDKFWHDDWEEHFSDVFYSFPLDVFALDGKGKVIATYNIAFDSSYYHHYFDHGDVSKKEFYSAMYIIREEVDRKLNIKD